uniref:Uncharacterized protein n=1 Tax=Anguilla anguilla TaxID=7936 RepID=A0A0E9PNB5_ANGAN
MPIVFLAVLTALSSLSCFHVLPKKQMRQKVMFVLYYKRAHLKPNQH